MVESLLHIASVLGWLTAPASLVALVLAMAKRWELARRAAWVALLACLLASVGFWSGLVKSFAAVAFAEAPQKSALLSRGISHSLYALILKILPAAPALVILFMRRRRVRRDAGA